MALFHFPLCPGNHFRHMHEEKRLLGIVRSRSSSAAEIWYPNVRPREFATLDPRHFLVFSESISVAYPPSISSLTIESQTKITPGSYLVLKSHIGARLFQKHSKHLSRDDLAQFSFDGSHFIPQFCKVVSCLKGGIVVELQKSSQRTVFIDESLLVQTEILQPSPSEGSPSSSSKLPKGLQEAILRAVEQMQQIFELQERDVVTLQGSEFEIAKKLVPRLNLAATKLILQPGELEVDASEVKFKFRASNFQSHHQPSVSSPSSPPPLPMSSSDSSADGEIIDDLPSNQSQANQISSTSTTPPPPPSSQIGTKRAAQSSQQGPPKKLKSTKR